ncbi:orotate phosphoribosyltransferase [Buchnera aphidicola]|uniref:orotate phosphoribosyltransferase n=1 Tax=Buchnera aphidicola TaxID=9 RepID=UPI003463D680
MTWKNKFIEFSLKKGALQFGNFKLKSGRNSPYFFNSKYFYTGSDLLKLSQFYVDMIIRDPIKIDILFGLAYKGIPIATTIAIILYKKYNINLKYTFNRKEIKTYGEKGIIVGNNIQKKNIIIIDDVITSGITIQESISIIQKNSNDNIISNIFVALDRRERGTIKKNSAIEQIKNQYSCNVFSIINIYDLIEYLSLKKIYPEKIKKIQDYQKSYGIHQ